MVTGDGEHLPGVQTVLDPEPVDQLLVLLLGLAVPDDRDDEVVQDHRNVRGDDPGVVRDPAGKLLQRGQSLEVNCRVTSPHLRVLLLEISKVERLAGENGSIMRGLI